MATRREVIQAAGAAATLGIVSPAFAADASNCMTILYPAGSDLKFDADYYRAKHLPLIMKLYTGSLERFELRKVPAAAGGAPQPSFAAAVNIWISELAAFKANNAKHGQQLVDDVKNFTNAQPAIQFDKVHGQAGAARSVPRQGETCLTILYPNGDGVRWDVEK